MRNFPCHRRNPKGRRRIASLLSSQQISSGFFESLSCLFQNSLEAETKCAVLVVVIRIHVLCNYTYIIWLMLIEGVLFRGEQ